jgi:hypothetical protein
MSTGEVIGNGHPDWPDDLTTYAERAAYQRGVADCRAADKAQQGIREQMFERAALVLLNQLHTGIGIEVNSHTWNHPMLDKYALHVEMVANGNTLIQAIKKA